MFSVLGALHSPHLALKLEMQKKTGPGLKIYSLIFHHMNGVHLEKVGIELC